MDTDRLDHTVLSEFGEAVLSLVEQVPRGRATTYGALADALFDEHGGGPRQVAAVMARHGSLVTWWRVVRADGTLPERLAGEARQAYLEEATPLTGTGAVSLRDAFWQPNG